MATVLVETPQRVDGKNHFFKKPLSLQADRCLAMSNTNLRRPKSSDDKRTMPIQERNFMAVAVGLIAFAAAVEAALYGAVVDGDSYSNKELMLIPCLPVICGLLFRLVLTAALRKK